MYKTLVVKWDFNYQPQLVGRRISHPSTGYLVLKAHQKIHGSQFFTGRKNRSGTVVEGSMALTVSDSSSVAKSSFSGP